MSGFTPGFGRGSVERGVFSSRATDLTLAPEQRNHRFTNRGVQSCFPQVAGSPGDGSPSLDPSRWQRENKPRSRGHGHHWTQSRVPRQAACIRGRWGQLLKWNRCSQKEESGHWARATGTPGTGPPQGERSHRAELQPPWSLGGLLPRQRGGHAAALGSHR